MEKGNYNYNVEIPNIKKIVIQIFLESSKISWLILLIIICPRLIYAQKKSDRSSSIPFSYLFYHMDRHLLGSYTMSYGLYHIATIPITYALIKSGADWKWNNFAYHHGYSNSYAAAEIGNFAPPLVSLSLYLYGISAGSRKLAITGLALGQAALLSVGISTVYKAFTGRRPPNDQDLPRTEADYSGDFHFGFMRRGVYEGWPSSHTMVSFAMATTLTELYPGNLTLAIISYTYASLIGVGVSTNIHWLSDAVAGAIIGYSIGKSVGSGFSDLLNGNESNSSSLNFSILPNGVEVSYVF